MMNMTDRQIPNHQALDDIGDRRYGRASPSLSPPQEAPMTGKWWTLAAVSLGIFMLLLDITIVVVALPDIERSLGAQLSDLQWVIDAYALSLAAFMLTAGVIADRVGRRVVFATGIVVFTLGSLLCGVAGDPTFLALARAVQGVGGAIMFATSLALLSTAYHGRDRGTAFGLFGAVTGVAVALGPVLGGAITSGLSWRWIFFVNLPIGVLALVVTLRHIAESRDPRPRRLDWAGFVTFSAGLGLLVFALIRSNEAGWGSTEVAGSMTAAVMLLLVFVVVEAAQREPMFDLSLLRVPTFVGGLSAAFGISASLFSLLTYLVLYLQNLLGYSAIEAGVRFLPLTLAIFFTAAVAGRLSATVPTRLLIGPGFVLIGVGLLLMHGIDVRSDWTALLAGMIVAGVGAGLVNVPLASTAVAVVEPARAGMASGINSTFRQAGIATGVAALGAIFAAAVPAGARGPAAAQGFVDGINDILLVSALIAFVAAIASFALIRQRDYIANTQGPPREAVAA
jgi:EmrB/QacA subfamily drug resistance transporter